MLLHIRRYFDECEKLNKLSRAFIRDGHVFPHVIDVSPS